MRTYLFGQGNRRRQFRNRTQTGSDPTIRDRKVVYESEHYDPERRYKIDNRTEIQMINQTLPNLDIHNRTVIEDTHQTRFDENFHAHNRTIVQATSKVGPNFRATKNRTIYTYSWNKTEEPEVIYQVSTQTKQEEERRLQEETLIRMREEERIRQEQILAEERRLQNERRVQEEQRLLEEERLQIERKETENRLLEEERLRLWEEERRLEEENQRIERQRVEARKLEEEKMRQEKGQEERFRKEENAVRVSFVTEPPPVIRQPPRRRPGETVAATRPGGGTVGQPPIAPGSRDTEENKPRPEPVNNEFGSSGIITFNCQMHVTLKPERAPLLFKKSTYFT